MMLKKAAVKGVAWNSLGSVGSGIINLSITIVLARLLTPSDFGLLELLIIFTVLSEALIDSGFSQAVIRDKEATQSDLSTVFYINIIISLLLYIILFISAPLIANFYDAAELVSLSRFVFLTLIIHALTLIQQTIYNKNLNFKAPAISSLFAVVLSGILSITLAINNFGVWALALQLVLYSFLKMIFLWFQSEWRPSGNISYQSLRKYFYFSSNLLAQGLIDKFVTNLESLLIGKIYSKSDLGFFSQGRKLNSYLMQTLSSVVQRVTYPVLAKIGDDKLKLKEGYRKIIGMTMLVMIPLSLGIAVSADTLIIVLFGEKWLQSANYLSLFIVMGLFTSLHNYYTNIFLVLGKSNYLLKLSLIKQFLKILVVVFMINKSIMALVIGVTCIGIITSIMYIYFGGKLINYSMKELLVDLQQIIIASFLGVVFIYIFNLYTPSLNPFLALPIQITIMLIVYLSFLFLRKNIYLDELLYLVKAGPLKQK